MAELDLSAFANVVPMGAGGLGDLYRATRIRLAGIYTLLYQEASTGRGPREAGGGDVDIIGTWDAVQRGGKTVGALDVAFEGRHKTWTEIPPASLSQTIDSLWTTTSGFNIQTFVPTQIYWRQALLRERTDVAWKAALATS